MTVPKFVQTDDPTFIRDTGNRALLTKDRAALERHRSKLAKAKSDKQRISTLEAQVAELYELLRNR